MRENGYARTEWTVEQTTRTRRLCHSCDSQTQHAHTLGGVEWKLAFFGGRTIVIMDQIQFRWHRCSLPWTRSTKWHLFIDAPATCTTHTHTHTSAWAMRMQRPQLRRMKTITVTFTLQTKMIRYARKWDCRANKGFADWENLKGKQSLVPTTLPVVGFSCKIWTVRSPLRVRTRMHAETVAHISVVCETMSRKNKTVYCI